LESSSGAAAGAAELFLDDFMGVETCCRASARAESKRRVNILMGTCGWKVARHRRVVFVYVEKKVKN